ncbi:MAG: sigma 54-interacting transcriptional regulator [Planctomycetota bacterium]
MFTPPLVVRSRVMQDTARLARMFARSRRPLLLRGPAGAGKRTLAAHVHHWSDEVRATYVDCADPREQAHFQIPGPWLRGLDPGTLVLAGVDTLSPAQQQGLALAIPRCQARVIGTARSRGRLVRPLLDAFALQLEVPGLAQRREDVTTLALKIASEVAHPLHVHLSATARHYLVNHDWPGNLSELRLLLTRALRAWVPSREPLKVTCPCGRRYQASQDWGGRRMRCRGCERRIELPTVDAPCGPVLLGGCELLRARAHPLLERGEEADWYRRERPRALRGPRRPRELRVTVSRPPREVVTALPATPVALELCARPREVVRALPGHRVQSAPVGLPPLPEAPRLPALPAEPEPLPPEAEAALLDLVGLLVTATDLPRRVNPPLERRWLPWLVLACARQLEFTAEGRQALRTAVPVFLAASVVALLVVGWG